MIIMDSNDLIRLEEVAETKQSVILRGLQQKLETSIVPDTILNGAHEDQENFK